MKLRDVNQEAAQLLVASGKGAKSRAVYLPAETAAAPLY
jgi:hypothetical protein